MKDGLRNGILLTNISYCTAHKEKVYRYFERAATEDSECVLILCHKITVTK